MNKYSVFMKPVDGNNGIITIVNGVDYLISENNQFRIIGEGMKTVFISDFNSIWYVMINE